MDAYPDPRLAQVPSCYVFLHSDFVGVGGPNLPPCRRRLDRKLRRQNSPGGPIHVMLTDREAEHIPGCNMAYRKYALLEIGGFDETFSVSRGDDVDVCWSLQKTQLEVGDSARQLLYGNHRRNSVSKPYLKQQRGYGRAEALLEKKVAREIQFGPGHVSWAGRVYGNGFFFTVLPHVGRIYQGIWGTAPFQRLYGPAPGWLSSLILIA